MFIKSIFFLTVFFFLMIRNSFKICLDAVGSKRFQWVLSEELPRLAKEVKRIDSIRVYLG